MEQPVQPRPWYKKKRYLGLLGGIAIVVAAIGQASPDIAVQPAQAIAPAVQKLATPATTTTFSWQQNAPTPVSSKPALSNDNYYTNTYRNRVHSPAYAKSVPAGASAQCGDGTYSFSQSRRGTCSHHGGVDEWL